MRYVLQRGKYDCAPTAIFNAMRHYEPKTHISRYYDIKRMCKVNSVRNGTMFIDLYRTIHDLFNVYHAITVKMTAYEALNLVFTPIANRTAIMGLYYDDRNSHACFLEKYLPYTKTLVVSGMYSKVRRQYAEANSVRDLLYIFMLNGVKNTNEQKVEVT